MNDDVPLDFYLCWTCQSCLRNLEGAKELPKGSVARFPVDQQQMSLNQDVSQEFAAGWCIKMCLPDSMRGTRAILKRGNGLQCLSMPHALQATSSIFRMLNPPI